MVRVGLIARADYTGLGMQTHAFYRHMNPFRTLVVDLSHLNNQKNDWNRYPGAQVLKYTPYPEPTRGQCAESKRIIDEFLDGVDLVFTCETPYDYYLITEARKRGIRTVLQYNFEFLDHVRDHNLPQPDLFMAPSLWRFDDVPFANKTFLPVPVDRSQFPFKKRTEANHFLHIGGIPTGEDRNGTLALMEAWRHVQSDAQLTIRTQSRFKGNMDSRINIVSAVTQDSAELYESGDVFIMPRKFGGLCLPLNEALSCGMPTVMSNVSPQSGFLRPELLVDATHSKQIMTKSMIDVYEINQLDMATKVDELYKRPELVEELSEWSNQIAESISWERLAPVYKRVFVEVMEGRVPKTPFAWGD